mmetsp:Transcript_119227/g.207518  ORF Transcript_119227/g.207518 Transcript_119227/m.207518 type:complete len:171 (-) Transcript_119227:542-1054(-)
MPICGLASDMLLHALTFLDCRQLVAFGSTSRACNKYVSQDAAWHGIACGIDKYVSDGPIALEFVLGAAIRTWQSTVGRPLRQRCSNMLQTMYFNQLEIEKEICKLLWLERQDVVIGDFDLDILLQLSQHVQRLWRDITGSKRPIRTMSGLPLLYQSSEEVDVTADNASPR